MSFQKSRGVTFTEVAIAAAVMGLVGLMTPKVIDLFNHFRMQQELVIANSDAKLFLQEIGREIRNAAYIRINSDFPNRLEIWQFDFAQYNGFEHPNLLPKKIPDPTDPNPIVNKQTLDNWGKITYEAFLKETTDINGNGTIDTVPFILRTETWPPHTIPAFHKNTKKTYFLGKVLPTRSTSEPALFIHPKRLIAGGISGALNPDNRNAVNINLRLAPPFAKTRVSPKTFIAYINRLSHLDESNAP